MTGEGTGAELVRVIRHIRLVENRINAIENEISEIKKSDYYKMLNEVKLARASGYDLLSKMASELDEQISERKKYMKELT